MPIAQFFSYFSSKIKRPMKRGIHIEIQKSNSLIGLLVLKKASSEDALIMMMIEDEDAIDVLECFAFIVIVVCVLHARYSQGYNQHTIILNWVKRKMSSKKRKNVVKRFYGLDNRLFFCIID